jgi:hypothetical protein
MYLIGESLLNYLYLNLLNGDAPTDVHLYCRCTVIMSIMLQVLTITLDLHRLNDRVSNELCIVCTGSCMSGYWLVKRLIRH